MTMQKKLMSSTSMPLKVVAMVLEGKGGVGKSVSNQAATAALELDGSRVHVAESDLTNSTMAMIHGAGQTTLVDADAVDLEGYLYDLAERAAAGEFEHVALDTGARDEVNFRPFVAEYSKEIFAKFGMRLCVIRPVTLSHFVQSNVLTFVKECKTDEMGVVILRNLSQGRTVAHFKQWEDTESTKALLRTPGVELCDLRDAGVQHSDNATSLGMSLVDAAMADFSRMGEDEEFARTIVPRPVQLFLQKWLERQAISLRAAIFASLGRHE